MKKASISLIFICLLSLGTCLWLHWRVEKLEMEMEEIYQQIYQKQLDSTERLTRITDIYQKLHGQYGLYSRRSRMAAAAGLSGFAFLCVSLERLKQWLQRETKSAPKKRKKL